jgi:hypothetical protein
MLWILLSLLFCWLIFRELQSDAIYKPYLAILVISALLSAWPPFHYWRIEHLLSAKATQLAESHRANVHCNTVFDTFLDTAYFASGHADPKTGQIVLQYPWCERLMNYIDHPERANSDEIQSLNMLTHESMHVRGEINEARTECEAVQRDYRAARLLGVPDAVARKNALDYYNDIYMLKGKIGGMQAPYFSPECAPNKALDEHLVDSTWGTP